MSSRKIRNASPEQAIQEATAAAREILAERIPRPVPQSEDVFEFMTEDGTLVAKVSIPVGGAVELASCAGAWSL
ncbi:DUF6894 family protein [Rhizobium laguerreae]|uniref:DUF6894 family protein n=1 Tax=Rhizobium laguerreae TaxID=1076926 RepID=UPI0035E4014B